MHRWKRIVWDLCGQRCEERIQILLFKVLAGLLEDTKRVAFYSRSGCRDVVLSPTVREQSEGSLGRSYHCSYAVWNDAAFTVFKAAAFEERMFRQRLRSWTRLALAHALHSGAQPNHPHAWGDVIDMLLNVLSDVVSIRFISKFAYSSIDLTHSSQPTLILPDTESS